MSTRTLTAILAIAWITALAGCGGPAPEVNDSEGGPAPEVNRSEIALHAGQLDVRFARGQKFAQTYMLFGGTATSHPNAISRVTLAGLPDYAARYIYQQYPDFHMCKSPGAPMAQNETRQIDIVPANSGIERRLKEALSMFDKNLREGGERVCVTLEGEMITLRSAVITEIGEDITGEFTRNGPSEYFFVTSASIGTFQEAVLGN
jgi:hypothetical protein